jgi:hypothetical protein
MNWLLKNFKLQKTIIKRLSSPAKLESPHYTTCTKQIKHGEHKKPQPQEALEAFYA